MNAQDYIDIAAICKAGSFRKAAAELGVSQPTLSHRIERSEKTLGAKLFERGPGRSTPTALALFIAGRAEFLVEESNALARETRRLLDGNTGRLTMGFGPIPAHAFLSEVLPEIHRAMPGLSIDVLIGAPRQLSDWLMSGHIDLAVCAHDPGLFPPPLLSEQLRDDPVVIAGHADHPALADGPEPIRAGIFDHSLAFPTLDERYRNAFISLYDIDYMTLDGALQCSDYAVLIRMAQSGQYLTAGPEMTFHRELAAGSLAIRPMDERLRHRLDVFTRDLTTAIPAVLATLDILRNVARAV